MTPQTIQDRIAHLESRIARERTYLAESLARATAENSLLQGTVSNSMNLQADIIELRTLREVVGGRYGVVGK